MCVAHYMNYMLLKYTMNRYLLRSSLSEKLRWNLADRNRNRKKKSGFHIKIIDHISEATFPGRPCQHLSEQNVWKKYMLIKILLSIYLDDTSHFCIGNFVTDPGTTNLTYKIRQSSAVKLHIKSCITLFSQLIFEPNIYFLLSIYEACHRYEIRKSDLFCVTTIKSQYRIFLSWQYFVI